MANIEQFEDIEGWQIARKLVKEVYTLTSTKPFDTDCSLRDQMRRAAVSIMSNIAEGFEGQTNKVFVRHLYIAKGSAGELRSQLYVCLDHGFIDTEEFNLVNNLALQCSRLISGFIKYLKHHNP